MEGLTPFLLLALLHQDTPEPLVVELLSTGEVRIEGRVFFKPKPDAFDTGKLVDFFSSRRQDEKYQVVKGKDDYVNYAIVVRPHRETPFHSIRVLYETAWGFGGVTRFRWMEWGDETGGAGLLTVVPADRGKIKCNPMFSDTRIEICVQDADEREREKHIDCNSGHDQRLEEREQSDLEKTAKESPAHYVLNDVCLARVEKVEFGKLFKSRKCSNAEHLEDRALCEEERDASNRKGYAAVATKCKELCEISKLGVLLDADAVVPYEHILRIMQACRDQGIERIDFGLDHRMIRKTK